MNVNININDKSGMMDLNAENTAGDTSFAPDAGAPPADIDPSTEEHPDYEDDATTSEGEDRDIGGPEAWLVEAMSEASDKEPNLSNDPISEDMDDAGSGPSE